jgi:hypothetical protein
MTRISLSLCILALTAVLAVSSAALAQLPPPDLLAANAALFYWRAFAVLPTLDNKQEDALTNAIDLKPLDASLASAVKLGEPAMRELHRAAQQPRCAWATPTEDGVATVLPHAGKARELGRLALARARWNFANGKPAAGVDDLIDAMTLARHTGGDRILITLLVDYTLETLAVKVAVADLNRMGPAELRQFAEKFDRLPPIINVSQAVLAERDMFLDPIIKLLSQPGGKEKVFEQFGGLPGNDPVTQALRGMSREQLLEGVIGVRPYYDKLAKLMEQGHSQMKKNEETVAKWLADPNLKEPTRTMAKMVLPGIAALKAEVRYKLSLALLRAAIAVQLEGPEALSNPAYHDPFANAPFQYEKLTGGFRLQSKTPNPVTNKPLALETGKGMVNFERE